MNKTRVTVTLDFDIEEWLRAGSKSSNKSLSELIRICLREQYLTDRARFMRTDKARSASEAAWKRG
jgi:hypothetical protein